MTKIPRLLAPLALALCGAGAVPAASAGAGGVLTLAVDLRDTAHKVYRVQEAIPAAPGTLTLLYPKWIPGEHGPTGTIDGVSGLVITVKGQPVSWRRDLEDMYRLRVDVPAGADSVDLAFQFLSPGPGRNFGGGVSSTPVMTMLEWNQVLFYPAGIPADQILVAPTIQLPPNWRWASALGSSDEQAAGSADAPAFAPVNLQTLLDSPVAAGRNFRRITLAPAPAPVYLDLVADRPENLAASEEQVRHQQRLVREAGALFGARHYRHYDFLLALSDQTAHFGLEHHESSDDRLDADFFTDPDSYLSGGSLLAHEYTHSWNGKYRRPAGLLTPDYSTPMQGDLLWVYEGLTNYWGEVLAARSGARTPEQFREMLAATAALMQNTPGRRWRPLQDTADEAQVLYNTPRAWSNWRRGVDFYDEGILLWLDVDTLIRNLSRGARSLDDFARAFHGQDDGSVTPRSYTFDDVVKALDSVQHYDWARLLRTRLDARDAGAPLDGVARAGWKLVYNDTPNAVAKAQEKVSKQLDLSSALGLQVDTGDAPGVLGDVIWQSPAFEAGLAPAMRIVAVNGTHFSAEVLKDAIKASRGSAGPLELLIEDFDQFRSVRVDYHEGLRYPHLVRVDGVDDLLGTILRPRGK